MGLAIVFANPGLTYGITGDCSSQSLPAGMTSLLEDHLLPEIDKTLFVVCG